MNMKKLNDINCFMTNCNLTTLTAMKCFCFNNCWNWLINVFALFGVLFLVM